MTLAQQCQRKFRIKLPRHVDQRADASAGPCVAQIAEQGPRADADLHDVVRPYCAGVQHAECRQGDKNPHLVVREADTGWPACRAAGGATKDRALGPTDKGFGIAAHGFLGCQRQLRDVIEAQFYRVEAKTLEQVTVVARFTRSADRLFPEAALLELPAGVLIQHRTGEHLPAFRGERTELVLGFRNGVDEAVERPMREANTEEN